MVVTEELRAVLRRGGAVAAWVFGSRAAGTDRPGSDVDLAVLGADGSPPWDPLALAGIAGEVEDLVGAEVDLVDFAQVPLELQARIVTTGVLVLSDDDALRVRTVVSVQSRWEDLRPAVQAMQQAYLRAVAERGLQTRRPAGTS